MSNAKSVTDTAQAVSSFRVAEVYSFPKGTSQRGQITEPVKPVSSGRTTGPVLKNYLKAVKCALSQF